MPAAEVADGVVETEAKLGAWPGFELPALDEAVPGLEARTAPPAEMQATYLDAADLRLIRAGISLRHRTGEGGAEGTWTVKLPAGSVEDGVLRREEVVVPGPAGRVPTELAALVRPWMRTAPLTAVAHLLTIRRPTLLALGGEVVGEVADDEVSVLRDGYVAARFREVEVESTDAEVLAAVVARLREAGAGAPDPTPKLVRALGPRAIQPPDLAAGPLPPDPTAAHVLRAGIAAAVTRIVEHDRVVRADVDPEGVHQARVGCRRLRSDLRTFRELLDTEWSEPLRDELRWFAGELGAVRDLDVLTARLRRQVDALPPEHQGEAAVLFAKLARERARHVQAAVAHLDGDRYLALLDRLVEAANDPKVLPEAERPAMEVIPPLAGAAFAKLRKAVRRLGRHPADEELHALRIKAKRARYAADVAVPVVGAPAKRYTKAMGTLQDELGDLHDCAVAGEWLAEAARGATRAQAFVLGVLAAEQRHEAERLRHEWRDAWDEVRRRRLTSWMHG